MRIFVTTEPFQANSFLQLFRNPAFIGSQLLSPFALQFSLLKPVNRNSFEHIVASLGAFLDSS
jgi:hypothetical protein